MKYVSGFSYLSLRGQTGFYPYGSIYILHSLTHININYFSSTNFNQMIFGPDKQTDKVIYMSACTQKTPLCTKSISDSLYCSECWQLFGTKANHALHQQFHFNSIQIEISTRYKMVLFTV